MSPGVRIRERAASVTRPLRRRLGLIERPYDRVVLEDVIFPALRELRDINRILFVGCDNYTEHYATFFADREFTTIDVDRAKARYGGSRHIVDSLANLEAHVEQQSLDAIICNGVIGWGLDDPEEIQRAIQASYDCLRPDGIFVLGWNDVPGMRAPFDVLTVFEPVAIPPFPTAVYPTFDPLGHVYSFYARPRATS